MLNTNFLDSDTSAVIRINRQTDVAGSTLLVILVKNKYTSYVKNNIL